MVRRRRRATTTTTTTTNRIWPNCCWARRRASRPAGGPRPHRPAGSAASSASTGRWNAPRSASAPATDRPFRLLLLLLLIRRRRRRAGPWIPAAAAEANCLRPPPPEASWRTCWWDFFYFCVLRFFLCAIGITNRCNRWRCLCCRWTASTWTSTSTASTTTWASARRPTSSTELGLFLFSSFLCLLFCLFFFVFLFFWCSFFFFFSFSFFFPTEGSAERKCLPCAQKRQQQQQQQQRENVFLIFGTHFNPRTHSIFATFTFIFFKRIPATFLFRSFRLPFLFSSIFLKKKKQTNQQQISFSVRLRCFDPEGFQRKRYFQHFFCL